MAIVLQKAARIDLSGKNVAVSQNQKIPTIPERVEHVRVILNETCSGSIVQRRKGKSKKRKYIIER